MRPRNLTLWLMKTLIRKNSKLVLAGIALATVTLATVFAAGRGNSDAAKCYSTGDGKYVCKATGEIMEKPCCDNSCCNK